MKLMHLAFVLLLAFPQSAEDVSGTWKAVFLGPIGERPKMVAEMVFDLKVDGDKLTGMAHMANWPGDAPISNGKVDGDRITFIVIGTLPWRSSSGSFGSVSGYPKLKFTGTLNGTDMKLTLNWGSLIDGKDVSAAELPPAGFARELAMQGKKVSGP